MNTNVICRFISEPKGSREDVFLLGLSVNFTVRVTF